MSTSSVKSYANLVNNVARLHASTVLFAIQGLKLLMMTKWPYTMNIKPNTRRKYAKNLYWLRKEIAKRSKAWSDTGDQKRSNAPNPATETAS